MLDLYAYNIWTPCSSGVNSLRIFDAQNLSLCYSVIYFIVVNLNYAFLVHRAAILYRVSSRAFISFLAFQTWLLSEGGLYLRPGVYFQ